MKDQTSRPSRHDAVVVGARCAGAATALLLAREGLRVLVVDRGRYGADTLSTHALMRGAVVRLHRWGEIEAIEAAGTPVVRTTSFHYADEVIRIPIKPRDGIPGLYAPRRTVIDRALVDAARDAGAEFAYGVHLVDLDRSSDGRVGGGVIEDAEGRLKTWARGSSLGPTACGRRWPAWWGRSPTGPPGTPPVSSSAISPGPTTTATTGTTAPV